MSHEVPVREGRQLYQPDAVLIIREHTLSDLDGEPRLANASRSSEGDQPVLGEQALYPTDLVRPGNKGSQRVRKIVRSRRAGRLMRKCQQRVMVEDPLQEVLQLGAGIHSLLVDEGFSRSVIDVGSLGLPTTAVQGQHQLPAKPLA